ncbi:NAD(P)/FAD-dependent oxidoreductase [Nocardioides sp. TRM66260-LWL]|uniref:flavin-containing monooxygenase n=1 Tax=Nocardioides sp. TRM66260-LWL TaxID=2874478 RepID=UPI001CC7CAD1|nr:NAD(P)/FAD-dependent oxidoreductase [Nocardioides sp. TRM66260-LWL]MBZ5734106.1 NAD(P)/FAD-dependent oxidoreductase [Nocardioides sp. TRM66260-LWL]
MTSTPHDPTPIGDRDLEVLIVGAGFSGIGAAISLLREGVDDLLIVEDGQAVGGTWHWNTYPGVAVDIPSFSYQFSFAQRTDWSRSYAKGAELARYAEDLVDEHGLRPFLRFGRRVLRAVWHEDDDRYAVELSDGSTLRPRFLVSACGVLTQPRLPDIPGVADFAGTTVHTARWDHAVDLAGQRVAVIGTGASGVQLIPEIAPDVASLTVFQRTPIWCFPKPDVPLPAPVRAGLRLPGARTAVRALSQAFVEVTFPIAAHYHAWFPLTHVMERAGRRWIAEQVDDPEVAARLTPAYGLGCKRPSFHNSYLATYNRPNVHLETTPIAEITPTGVRTSDGTEHEIDVLVLATGFKVMEPDNLPTFELRGVDGVTTAAYFAEHRLRAYEGVSVPGFPNCFMVFGPYGYNGSSYFALIEAQVHHIVRVLRAARRRSATRVEVTREADDRFFAGMLRRRHRQVFWQESCTGSNSYYFDEHGDVPLRPTTTVSSALASRTFPLDDYAFSG